MKYKEDCGSIIRGSITYIYEWWQWRWMQAAPAACWTHHSRHALRVCSHTVGLVRRCWPRCWWAPMSLGGKQRCPRTPPTDRQSLRPSHTWRRTSLPVCLPGREVDPTSLSAPSRYCDDVLWGSREQRAALWGAKTCLLSKIQSNVLLHGSTCRRLMNSVAFIAVFMNNLYNIIRAEMEIRLKVKFFFTLKGKFFYIVMWLQCFLKLASLSHNDDTKKYQTSDKRQKLFRILPV